MSTHLTDELVEAEKSIRGSSAHQAWRAPALGLLTPFASVLQVSEAGVRQKHPNGLTWTLSGEEPPIHFHKLLREENIFLQMLNFPLGQKPQVPQPRDPGGPAS